MASEHRVELVRPSAQRRFPAGRFRADRGPPQRGVDHDGDELRAAGYIAVQRHRGEAEPVGNPLHGDRRQAFGIGDVTANTIDATGGSYLGPKHLG